MTTSEHAGPRLEQTLWFGAEEQPLFGWLTSPSNALARGGVLLAPPIGREAFPARRVLKSLATSLAARGFVTLRFDYHGTGDSSGHFDDPDRDRAWVDSVADAAAFLRSLGLSSISAVGMRFGATLVGAAAATHDLRFKSMVLWDPCESGRSYLRELTALEGLRRDDYEIDPDGSVETSEFVFTQRAAVALRALSLTDVSPRPLAERVMVVERGDRVMSKKLRLRLDREKVDWESTFEQGPMIDVEAFFAVMPDLTLNRIVNWLGEPSDTVEPFDASGTMTTAVVSRDSGEYTVEERSLELGPSELFGVLSEPVGDARGPWIVLLNSVNDDHVGRARLWVELSRRWASYGLRCVRVDLSGYGDSPSRLDELARVAYDSRWTGEMVEVARTLSPEDPSNVVFIGLCSGAYVAIEGALAVHARGVCAINPPVFIDYLHGVARLEASRRTSVRALGLHLKRLALSHQWVAATLARFSQMMLRSAYPTDVLSKLVDDGTDVLVLASFDDLSPCPRTPFLRSIDLWRMGKTKNYQIEFVPGLDHGLHGAKGRARAVSLLDGNVLERFARAVSGTDPK